MAVAVVGLLIGLSLGSFVKATVDRLILNKSLKDRSHCLSCKHTLGVFDLIPVLSYLSLGGKCRYCQKNIPLDNLLFELALGLVVSYFFYLNNNIFSLNLNFQQSLVYSQFVFGLFAITILAIVFWIDLKTGLIHDKITYPAITIAAVFLLIKSIAISLVYYLNFQDSYLSKYLSPTHSDFLISHIWRIWQPAALAFASALASALVFGLLIAATRGRGMGWGDVKYVLFLGLVLGFPQIVVGLFGAFLTGAIFSIGLILAAQKKFGQTIPFGPFLSLGALVSLLWGEALLNWYLHLAVL